MNLHLRVPPVLDVEDPYVVVLDPPLGAPEAQEGGAPESDPEYRARWAFGMAGSAVEHKKELQVARRLCVSPAAHRAIRECVAIVAKGRLCLAP